MIEAGQNIKVIRELKNFTQDYVATRLNMSVPNYSNIETGKTDVTLTRLQQIATVLQIDFRQILNLNRAKMLSPGSEVHAGIEQTKNGNCCQEMVRQLQIKDEQISRLLDILRKEGL
jgi:transcriptional regulator with XRE-family HTH domain